MRRAELRRRQSDADLCRDRLVNGDTLTGALATTATTTSNVGAYGITQGTLAASANYALTYTGNTLTVTAAPLTVTANNGQSMVYWQRRPDRDLCGDRLGQRRHADRRARHAATAASNVGSYAITQGSLGNSNYTIAYTGANLAVAVPPDHRRGRMRRAGLRRCQSDADL